MLVMVDDGGRVVDEEDDDDDEIMLSELGDEELVDTDDERSTIGPFPLDEL